MELLQKQKDASQWVHNYSDLLYGFALQRVKNSDTAKDLVQETFLAAWRNMDNYNGEASVKTWLFTILKNKIVDYYRKAANRLTDELVQGDSGLDSYFDEADHWAKNAYPSNWGINYDSRVETKEFYVILQSCKGKLKEIQSAVFNMKYMDGLDSEEICKVLQLSASNYWVLVHRAKVQLRSCLEKNWFIR